MATAGTRGERFLFFAAALAASLWPGAAPGGGLCLLPTCSAFSGPQKGFGASPTGSKQKQKQKKPKPAAIALADDETAEKTARSLFGVCSHLQNPELYSPPWAGACKAVYEAGETGSSGPPTLVASEDIARGDIVTMYPIHSLGLRGDKSNAKNNKKKKKKKNKNKTKGTPNRRTTDYLVYDADRDGAFFGSSRRTTMYCVDFPAMTDKPELRGQSLFLDANPDRELVPGWLGHLCERTGPGEGAGTRSSIQRANCAAIPIEGAAPLCMVVATADVSRGDKLVRDIATNEGRALERERITQSGHMALEKHNAQLSELRAFTDMAYARDDPSEGEPPKPRDSGETTTEAEHGKRYKKINTDYPGLVEFHRDPDVYAVEGFLTPEECDRIIDKCKPYMSPCLVFTTGDGGDDENQTTEATPDPSRTSTESMLPQADAPTLLKKLKGLLRCKKEELEVLQILRYEKGQEFRAHTDGFDGPVTAAGFENSGRLVTIFVYLNDVPRGGHTEFSELGFTVEPKKGSAIVHFPATLGLEEDPRTVHRGMPAVDEKWILATWVWKDERTDPRYAESRLPPLGGEPI